MSQGRVFDKANFVSIGARARIARKNLTPAQGEPVRKMHQQFSNLNKPINQNSSHSFRYLSLVFQVIFHKEIQFSLSQILKDIGSVFRCKHRIFSIGIDIPPCWLSFSFQRSGFLKLSRLFSKAHVAAQPHPVRCIMLQYLGNKSVVTLALQVKSS